MQIDKPHLLRLSYKLLLLVLFPFILFITLRDSMRRKGGMQFIAQRFGFNFPLQENRPIWLHAASIGELNAALPLLKLIEKHHSTLPLIITTSTASAAHALKRKHSALTHCFLPLDYTYAINRFLKSVQPRVALIMETELWPNLYEACHNAKTPIVIINGRISNKTFQTSHWQQKLYQNCLQQCSQILTRSQLDHERFIKLGADGNNTRNIGNLKFAVNSSSASPLQSRPLEGKYVLAASTHDNEEEILAQCWQNLQLQDYTLVIVPRHPERRVSIIKKLERLNLKVAMRSRNETVNSLTNIYLADTIGELMLFMQFSEIVFMGGSLIAHGGQNILEPASLGKAIITGPHMHNFEDELKQLKDSHAIIQINHPDELQTSLRQLLNNKQECEKLSQSALRLMQKNHNIAEEYYQAIKPYLNSASNNSAKDA